MKFKALRSKKTGEFATIATYGGRYVIYTHDLPNPQPITATFEKLIDYYNRFDVIVDGLNCDDYELVTLECHEISE